MSDEPQGVYGFDYRRAKTSRDPGRPTVTAKPLADVSRQAVEVLVRELGVVDTVRFLGQLNKAFADYTAERAALLDKTAIEEIIAEIRASAKTTAEPGGPGQGTEGRGN